MSLDAPTLSRLCGDVDAFVESHWEKAPLLHHGGSFDDLFSIETADALLGAGALQVPNFLRLSRIEPTISDWEKHCRWIETELGQLTPIIDTDSAIREFERGRTIIFHSLRERVPELDRFGLEIEREIGHRVTADAFITPPHSQCWEPHYDVVDLFVVQIHGSKEWRLWEPTVAVPMVTHCPDQSEARGEPQQLTLHPGDVLYVPRGTPHAASTLGGTSVHLTVSINVTAWRDAIRMLLGSLHRRPELRASLPVGFPDEPSLLLEGTRSTLDIVASMLDDWGPEDAAAVIAGRSTPRRHTRVGDLAQSISRADHSART